MVDRTDLIHCVQKQDELSTISLMMCTVGEGGGTERMEFTRSSPLNKNTRTLSMHNLEILAEARKSRQLSLESRQGTPNYRPDLCASDRIWQRSGL